jgi:phage terminase large subunit-like protein
MTLFWPVMVSARHRGPHAVAVVLVGGLSQTITAYATYGADRIVAEVNNGGDMVGETIRMVDANAAFTAVRASRGKMVRAEPVAALYQQGRVHHIGTFPQHEDQMTNFTSDIDRAAAGYSPDRVDALVWAFSELLSGGKATVWRSGATRQEPPARSRPYVCSAEHEQFQEHR